MQYDDLDKSELLRRLEKLERLVTQAPIGYSSVTHGALRILSEEGLVVGEAEGENAGQGSQKVYGTVEITGTLRGDGTIDWDGPADFTGRLGVTGTMHVTGGGRIVSSDVGDVNYSMQMFYKDGTGNVIAFGVPMVIQAWSSVVQLNEDALRISTVGNASVQLNRDGLRIEAGGNSITMSEDSMQIVGNGGAAGTWLEFKDGDFFVHNLPTS
ncbi:hypothetical protein [Rathayibacter sp. VKM Ac-2927]|uniref:hypothetical protein n=1 Tax=Rathayibacter sp. VKM Ac-2927 TaxID=2929478 RepID=UPI001FB482E9|nr:hypothetical protein [Rathayibacter sp. VKM Ac-2927]MCJ1687791.1 hypothetical protein [Rathayibacter sp. VKM Ac-2927]